MWQHHPRQARHAKRLGDELSLIPEVFGYEGYHWRISFCNVVSVTHGAGSTTASMPICGDRDIAFSNHLVKYFVVRGDSGIVLIPESRLDIG